MDKAAKALGPWAHAGWERVDALLAARFEDAWPPRFQEACRYPIATGGKRMRPLLVLAAAEALGCSDDATVQHAAAAVELVHTYSLVHDDLPAMDDDAERRGRPTVHIAYDEATAILVGDALLTEAFAVIADCPASAETRMAMTRCLARAAGHRGMVGGQAADVGLGGPVGDLDAFWPCTGARPGPSSKPRSSWAGWRRAPMRPPWSAWAPMAQPWGSPSSWPTMCWIRTRTPASAAPPASSS